MPTTWPPISVQQLDEERVDPRLRVVDCRFYLSDPQRGHEEYERSHIPAAVYADLDHDLSAPVTAGSGRHPLPPPESFVVTLRRLGISDDSRVVAYDDASGAVAARLWWMLRWVGHEAVTLLDGGYAAWQRAGLPTVSGEESAPSGRFSLRKARNLVWSTAQVAAMVDRRDAFLLVDARDAARFRGEVEPIDTVAGHVPGAVNLPFPASLDANGQWRSAAELRDLWDAVAHPPGDAAWGVMCGSGVTACHLAMSALLAGLPEPSLYAGSWSEWIRRPDRPVARGS